MMMMMIMTMVRWRRRRRSYLRSSSCPALTSFPAQALRQEACRARPKEKESLQEVEHGEEVVWKEEGGLEGEECLQQEGEVDHEKEELDLEEDI